MNQDLKFKLRNYLYYAIIALVSLITLIFAPMLGTTVDMGLALPETVGAWIVYVVTKALVATLNLLIFHSFLQQARINVRDDEKYLEAMEIMDQVRAGDVKPRSPRKWKRQQYAVKGTTVFVSSALSAVALTNAILTYDYVSLITYLIVVVTGIVFGVISMKNAEEYWTNEFWHFAKGLQERMESCVRSEDVKKALANLEKNLRDRRHIEYDPLIESLYIMEDMEICSK